MSRQYCPQVTAEHWHNAARADDVDHDALKQHALAHCAHALGHIDKEIDPERARYHYLAQRFADYFWAQNIARRTKFTPGYPGHHGCRVRFRSSSLEAHWYYNRFVPRKSGQRHSVYSDHICKEGTFRYPKRAFNRAEDWEKAAIEQTESGFELIRKLNNNSMKIRRLTRTNRRLLLEVERKLAALTHRDKEFE